MSLDDDIMNRGNGTGVGAKPLRERSEAEAQADYYWYRERGSHMGLIVLIRSRLIEAFSSPHVYIRTLAQLITKGDAEK